MLSLEGALRTCKVNTGWANRIQSDRFENPDLMVCPVWNGVDLAGRPVCADSFYTKRAGCNSAEDRVIVENAVSRPQYVEYLGLDAAGINAPLYGSVNMHKSDQLTQNATMNEIPTVAGAFNLQNTGGSNQIQSTCAIYAYQQAMAQEAQDARMREHLQLGVQNYALQNSAGNV